MAAWPLERLWQGVAAAYFAAFVVLFATHADVFLYREGDFPLRPSLALVVLALPLLAYLALRLVTAPALRRDAAAQLAASLRVILPLLALTAVSLLLSVLPGAYWQEGARFILLYAFDLTIFACALALAWLPELRRLLRPALAVAFLVFLATVLVDTVWPGTFSKQMSRAAGLMEEANGAVFVMVLLLVGVLRFERLSWPGVGALLLGAGGVLATLSRSGSALFSLLVLSYAWFASVGRWSRADLTRWLRRLVLGGLVLAAVAIAGWLGLRWARHAPGMFERPVAQQRLDIFSGVDSFLDNFQDRTSLIVEAVELIGERPWLGHGTGFSQRLDRRAHNTYLDLWVNLGIPGLLCYLWWLGAALALFWRQRYPAGQVLVLLVGCWGLVSHTLVHDRTFLLVFGFVVSLAVVPRRPELADTGR